MSKNPSIRESSYKKWNDLLNALEEVHKDSTMDKLMVAESYYCDLIRNLESMWKVVSKLVTEKEA